MCAPSGATPAANALPYPTPISCPVATGPSDYAPRCAPRAGRAQHGLHLHSVPGGGLRAGNNEVHAVRVVVLHRGFVQFVRWSGVGRLLPRLPFGGGRRRRGMGPLAFNGWGCSAPGEGGSSRDAAAFHQWRSGGERARRDASESSIGGGMTAQCWETLEHERGRHSAGGCMPGNCEWASTPPRSTTRRGPQEHRI